MTIYDCDFNISSLFTLTNTNKIIIENLTIFDTTISYQNLLKIANSYSLKLIGFNITKNEFIN